jgi:diguanylate cyclase (GGDEF)-like protein
MAENYGRMADRYSVGLCPKTLRAARCMWLLMILAFVAAGPAGALDPTKAFSQYMQTNWNAQNGLRQKTVNAVAQTADGFLWLATEEGLIRFDGQSFLTFDERNAPGLGDRLIRSLAPSPDGGMWIGTMTGLVRYDHGHFSSLRDQTRFYSDIYDLGLTGDGSVWFSSDSGLRRYNIHGGAAAIHVYTVANGLPSDGITGMAAASDGSIWIGTRRGLVHYAGDRFASYACKRCKASSDIVSVARGRNGTVWAGMSDGSLARWADGQLLPAWGGAATRGASVVSMSEDQDGTLWIAFRKLGLGRFRHGELELLTHQNGLPSINPDWIFEDRERNLWVGWADAGLSMFRDGRFTIFGKSEGLSSDVISSVIEGDGGDLLVGTEDAGMNRLAGFSHSAAFAFGHPAVTRLPGTGVMALLQQRGGTLWVGSDRGAVTRISNGHATTFKVPGPLTPGLPAMVEDAHGDPWFGFDMQDGLARLHDGHLEFKHMPGGIKALALAPDGSLWIASYRGGVIHYADGIVRIYTEKDGLSNLLLTSIYVDPEGTVWAGTLLGGLNRIQNGRITNFSVEQGLSDSTVGEIIADRYGYLWLAGTRGIMRVRLKELNAYAAGSVASVSTRSFGYADGLRSDECNFKSHPAALKDENGRLWFATLSGLAMIDPAHIMEARDVTRPLIEGLFTMSHPVRADSSGLRVAPGSRNLLIRFAAPTFISPEQMQLRYRLVGLEDQWLHADARQGVAFSNLPHGFYRFELEASDSGHTAELSFEVLPHYYETLWFRVLSLLAGVLVIWLGSSMRTRVLVGRTMQLEKLVLEKTADVRAALASAEQARELLREQAMRDALTALWNRRAIFEILDSELLRSQRGGSSLVVIMADIDHFKSVNDTWGHQAGDQVIREISHRLRTGIRTEDAVGRYGGEELLVILPNASLAEGLQRAEDLRSSICARPVDLNGFSIPISCSFGLAQSGPLTSGGELVGNADAALYQAKRDGRNCVRQSESTAVLG